MDIDFFKYIAKILQLKNKTKNKQLPLWEQSRENRMYYRMRKHQLTRWAELKGILPGKKPAPFPHAGTSSPSQDTVPRPPNTQLFLKIKGHIPKIVATQMWISNDLPIAHQWAQVKLMAGPCGPSWMVCLWPGPHLSADTRQLPLYPPQESGLSLFSTTGPEVLQMPFSSSRPQPLETAERGNPRSPWLATWLPLCQGQQRR